MTMKEPFSFEKGRVVRSTQGRDRGRNFLVLENLGGDMVTIADGLTHTLARPKKKENQAFTRGADCGKLGYDPSGGRKGSGQRPAKGAGTERIRGGTLAVQGGLIFCPRAT